MKRETTDIKDDAKHKRKNSQSFLFKLEKDFNKPENNEFLTFVKNFLIFNFIRKNIIKKNHFWRKENPRQWG